jgi:hypothetical protein
MAAGIALAAGGARAATFTVTSGADGGAGTLRAAVTAANSTPGADAVTFAIPHTDSSYDAATGRYTISLLTPLPLLAESVTITGPGANLLTIRRSPSAAADVRDFRIFYVSGGTYLIADLTISSGRLLYVAGSEVFVPDGGGIYNAGSLTLTRVVVSGNAVVKNDASTGTSTVAGGGIYSTGTLNLIGSTVSGNTLSGATRSQGGGIANFGTLNLTNSTVSGNSAVSSASSPASSVVAQGGGIYNFSGAVRLTSSTVTDNSADAPPESSPGAQGGGIANILNSARPGTVTLRNSIVADNRVAAGGAGPDLSGAFNSLDFNLIGNTAGATIGGSGANDIRNQNPLLGPLTLDGGQTPTHAPQAGSPALDKGEASFLSADQRGFPRPADDPSIGNAGGDGSDIGAYEAQPCVGGVSPPAGRASGGQQITLTGSFAGVAGVRIGGADAQVTGSSPTQITVTSPAHAPGAADVTLIFASGGTCTRPNAFAYLPTVFTDDTLIAGVTPLRALHVTELRQAADSLRAAAGLPAAQWTEPVLLGVPVRAAHVAELRALLEEAAARLGYPAAAYTDPQLAPGAVVKRAHIEELRQRVRNIAG